MMPSSIFNDVIGPVMRGPSSSHCAASLRIGRMCLDLMGGAIMDVLIEYDPNGSLATTHKSQGSDMGLFGGFLGWEADDPRLENYQAEISAAGIYPVIEIKDIGADHPNTYQINLKNGELAHQLIALSIGGGMIEVISIDGAKVNMTGGYFENLIFTANTAPVVALLKTLDHYDDLQGHEGEKSFVNLKCQSALSEAILNELNAIEGVEEIRCLRPVLPVKSRKNLSVPFSTCEEMLAYNEDKDLELWELAVAYESARGNISSEQVYEQMKGIVAIMSDSIKSGLKGTEYKDRILGYQSGNFKTQMEQGKLVAGDSLNRIILFVTAMMEVKSSMGVIVAAPTAGSCGALPGAILGVCSALDLGEEAAVKAMLAAGIIGVFISERATFAAEVGGCQAECGSGSGMAAAGIVGMMGGSLHQALAASSMALQNSLGMICDPVANRVEAPCLGRNVMAASNALSTANMALADYDHLVPLDQVIEAMDEVGHAMAHELRCTGLGGLSISKASREIEAKLAAMSGEEPLTSAAQKFKFC
ncbi:MAG: L-serine ammonia-lyase, iron-sulfur-dependent, subunit alpha [Roseivirga sp.]